MGEESTSFLVCIAPFKLLVGFLLNLLKTILINIS